MAIIFSIGVFLFAINSSLFIAIPAIALAGVASTISAIGMQSLVQLNCDPSLRGRILSLYQLVFRGITPLGTFVIGIVAHWFSLKLITALSAIIVALILLYYVCSNSSLKVEIVEEALTE
jgi:predicted MFS family arabinose efflux permease